MHIYEIIIIMIKHYNSKLYIYIYGEDKHNYLVFLLKNVDFSS